MLGLTLESLRAISTQANLDLADAQRNLEHAQQQHRSAMQKAVEARQAYDEAQDAAVAGQARARFMDADDVGSGIGGSEPSDIPEIWKASDIAAWLKLSPRYVAEKLAKKKGFPRQVGGCSRGRWFKDDVIGWAARR
jgi:hypothetical protein